ncbi:hypothetical protein D3C80_2060260 [compost metagenome]
MAQLKRHVNIDALWQISSNVSHSTLEDHGVSEFSYRVSRIKVVGILGIKIMSRTKQSRDSKVR